VSDTVYLLNMEFEGHHGVSDEERADPQVIEMDVEYAMDLRPAGTSDDLAATVSYSDVFKICRRQVEDNSYHLLEAIAEHTAADILDAFERIESVTVWVRKPGVPIDGVLEHAGVKVERNRS